MFAKENLEELEILEVIEILDLDWSDFELGLEDFLIIWEKDLQELYEYKRLSKRGITWDNEDT